MKATALLLIAVMATTVKAQNINPDEFFALSDPIRGGYRYALSKDRCQLPITGVSEALIKHFDLIANGSTKKQPWHDGTVGHYRYGQFPFCWTEVIAEDKNRAVLACTISEGKMGADCVLLGWSMFVDTRTLPPAPKRYAP